MKKIFLLFVLILLIGCAKQEIVEEEPIKELKPAMLGIDVIEKTTHTSIVSEKAKNIFIVLTTEIVNIGEVDGYVNKSDIKLVGDYGEYKVDDATAIYTRKYFPFDVIKPGKKVTGKLVFDVPDADASYTLVIKGFEDEI